MRIALKLFMTLLVMLAMTLTASATVTNFISDVMLIGNSNHTSFDNQVSDSVAAGWTDINKDLNAGAGGNYIHLLYKTLSSDGSTGFPITGFYIRTGANPPDSLTYDERTYYLVPCAGSTSFVNGHGDLNAGCGSGSAYIFLYYTKGAFSNHESVTTITFNNTQDGGVGANGGDTGYDLNSGCGSGSAYIYMHVATQLPEGTTAPQRHLDACTGGEISIFMQGWTFDPDAPWASLDVHVYVYTDASCSSQSQYGQVHVLHANVPRPDVNNAYHIVGNHGFNETIPIADAGNYWVKVWAINYNGGSNPQIGATTEVTVTHTVTLTSQSGEVLLQDGDILIGTGGANTHVTIADGATVTLSGVNITALPNDPNHRWAGITCLGDAVIVMAEGTTNDITGGYNSSGIYVPTSHTLTLRGSGMLNATGKYRSAGIGSDSQSACGNITINGGTVTATGGGFASGIGSGHEKTCGNITISGGTVTATGSYDAAGIGSGFQSACGDITINGGTVTATGGNSGAGIGSGGYDPSCGNITINGGTITATGGQFASGIGSGEHSTCGNITITNGVTMVTAIKGQNCSNAIGAGSNSTCQTVTIGGVETGFITQSPFVTFPYTVAFNANGGTGTMDDQILMYNVAQNLNANSFTRAYYQFDGWATLANGPKVFDDEENVINLADTIATVTLYAKWYFVPTKEIVGYSDVSNPGGWYLIASPVVEAIAPFADNGFLTSEYDLYYFNQSFPGAEWRNYKVEDFILTNGTGYLYASEMATTLTFTGTPYTGDGEIELAYNPNVPGLASWNLVGNPFAETAYVDRDFYVMNNDGSEIIAAEGSAVEAMEGIFVVADSDGETVTFSPTSIGTRHDERIVLNLTRDSGIVIDRAIVRFGKGQQLPKFMLNEAKTKMYITKEGSDYAVVQSDKSGKLHVNFEPAEDGTYVISANVKNVGLRSLYLVDNMLGEKVDLLRKPEYKFEAGVGDKPDRFDLVYEE